MSINIITTTETVTTADLGVGYDTWDEVASKVFEVLCRLAWPHLTSYHSDLYVDAGWLRSRFAELGEVEEFTFAFNYAVGLDGYGTRIGFDEYILDSPQASWRVEVSADGRRRFRLRAVEVAL